MALKDINAEAVTSTLREFDALGEEAFLAKYGFRPARSYFLLHAGREYPSKAVVGAAHAYIGPGSLPIPWDKFSGGEARVARKLRSLGFEVVRRSRGTIPFTRGEVYNRSADILGPHGGQRQRGISTPSDSPFIFLFTGESGEQFGYRDGWREDGLFAYTGEGQKGDMRFTGGNRAIRDHVQDGKDLLLFQILPGPGDCRFLGVFACAGTETAKSHDREGHDRDIIVFLLAPLESVAATDVSSGDDTAEMSFEVLRERAYAAAVERPEPRTREAARTYYARSAVVKAYVLRRANGVCECCGNPAPFLRADGTPYLEPHHTHRLADGGPDHPEWVAAICPTCHRHIHHGIDGQELNHTLRNRLELSDPRTGHQ